MVLSPNRSNIVLFQSVSFNPNNPDYIFLADACGNLCQNGGSCGSDLKCHCVGSYGGRHCEISMCSFLVLLNL